MVLCLDCACRHSNLTSAEIDSAWMFEIVSCERCGDNKFINYDVPNNRLQENYWQPKFTPNYKQKVI